MARWAVAALGAAFLAGCGGGDSAEPVPPADAPAVALAAAPDCSFLPDFVKLYEGAKVSTCVKGDSPRPDHESGTVIYTTAAAPAEVLAWYKAEAKAAGLADSLSSEAMYSARDGEARSVMALVAPSGAGTQVTLNWGRDIVP